MVDPFANPLAANTGPALWSFTTDATAPVATITSPPAANPIYGTPTIPYTVSFNKFYMNDATVTAADFVNAGTASISVGTVTRVSAASALAVYSFDVTTSSPGTVQLRIAGPISDTLGNAFVAPFDDTDVYTLAAGPEPAKKTITLDGVVTVNTGGAPKTFTYDAHLSDKLVVVVTGEHNFGSNTSGDVTSITYDGTLLTKAIDVAPPSATNQITSDLWYLDNPGLVHTAGSITVSMVGNGNNFVHTAFGLSGTAPGFGAAASTIASSVTKMVVSSPSSYVISWVGMGGAGNTASTATTVTANSPAGAVTFGAVKITANYAGQALAHTTGLTPDTTTFSFNTALTDILGLSVEFLAADAAIGTPYDTWAGGPFAGTLTDPSAGVDFDNGGLATGIEWVVGGDPTNGGDDASVAPVLDNTTDPDFFIFTYRRDDDAAADANTAIKVEYGSALAGWTPATAGPDIIITPTDDGAGVGIDSVQVKIRRTLAVGGKLFARLNVVVTP